MVKGFNGKSSARRSERGQDLGGAAERRLLPALHGRPGLYRLLSVERSAQGRGPLGAGEPADLCAGHRHRASRWPGPGRSAVGGKSPLTGGYGEADMGGFFGAELKRAGYDAMVIKGKAAKPVYLWIKDGEVEIRSAEHLWGKTTNDTQEAIRQELGDKRIRVAMIGPGGEKLVRIACVMNDLVHAAGRTGMGAVMGSKNLKAVAARATQNVPVADPDGVKEMAKFMRDVWKERAYGLHDTGTDGGLSDLSEFGALPTRNFQDGQFEGADKINGATMRDTILVDRDGCYACPIHCKRVVKVDDADYKVDPIYGGPEYETMRRLRLQLRRGRPARRLQGQRDLQRLRPGYHRHGDDGLLCHGVLRERAAHQGGHRRARPEVRQRQGDGRAGADDRRPPGPGRPAGRGAAPPRWPRSARRRASSPWRPRDSPIPMHECRTRHGQALGYAVSPTGADHVHNYWDGGQEKEPLGEDLQSLGIYEARPQTTLDAAKVRAYTAVTNWSWIHNHLGDCNFVPWSRDELVKLVERDHRLADQRARADEGGRARGDHGAGVQHARRADARR